MDNALRATDEDEFLSPANAADELHANGELSPFSAVAGIPLKKPNTAWINYQKRQAMVDLRHAETKHVLFDPYELNLNLPIVTSGRAASAVAQCV
jgi:hypothetical protein